MTNSALFYSTLPSFRLAYFKPRIIIPIAQESNTESEVASKTEVKEKSCSSNKEDKKIGVWSEREHERFIEAMELYGNDWPSVVKYIGTRTANQVRSHAQKYYRKLKRKAIKKIQTEGKKKVFVIIQCYRNKPFVPKSHIKKANRSL